MSLDWNFAEMKDSSVAWEKAIASIPDQGIVEGEEYLTVFATNLIHLTMVIGIGVLTEKNFEEFMNRVAIYQALVGPYRRVRKDGVFAEQYLTDEDVRPFIGMRTNVSTISRSTFMKNVIGQPWHTKDLRKRQKFLNERAIA
jgi:hypothetical protein